MTKTMKLMSKGSAKNLLKSGKGLVICGLGLLITLSLLVFMTQLIHKPEAAPVKTRTVTTDKGIVERIEKLKPVTETPQPPAASIEPAIEGVGELVVESPSFSNLEPVRLDLGVSSDIAPLMSLDYQQSAPLADSAAVAIFQAQPQYPITALSQGIEGWVKLSYDVDTLGKAVNIKVIAAKPRKIFDLAAKRALKRWKFKAANHNGLPVVLKNQQVEMQFTLEQEVAAF